MRSTKHKKYTYTLTFFMVIYFLTMASSRSFAAYESKKEVLILNSYEDGIEWSDNIIKGINNVLGVSGQNIDIHIRYMNSNNRTFDKKYFEKLYELYKYEFSNKKFDVIITTDDNAYYFLLKYQKGLFPNTPVIFCGVNTFEMSQLKNQPLFTGIVETIDIDNTIEMALKLHPNVKNITVIGDDLMISKFYVEQLQRKIPKINKIKNVDYFNNLSRKEVQQKVQNLDYNNMVLLLPFYKDRDGETFSINETVSLINQKSSIPAYLAHQKLNIPIYSFWDVFIKNGVLGGMVVNSYGQGEMAAKIALRVLMGEKVSNIPVIHRSTNQYMFNYEQMQKFAIQTDDLPLNSIIVNKPSNVYSVQKDDALKGILILVIFLISTIVILIRNILMRRETEKILRESEERYKRLVELSPDAIILHENGKVCFVNPAAVKLFGADSEKEIVGRSVFDSLAEKYHEKVKERFLMIIEKGKTVPPIEEKIVRMDGEIVDIEVTSTLFPDQNRTVILSVAREITEKKLLDEAREYDKVKNEFFSNLSHELRTPLNILLSTLEVLDLSIKEMIIEKQKRFFKYSKTMRQNCYRLLRLVNNLIDITKIDTGFFEFKLENHNIVNIVEEITMSVIQYAQNNQITVLFDTELEEKIIACDPDKIERIMLNLLSNAIKFTKPGGSIFVNIFDRQDDIRISVKDTGIGIKQEEQKMIFERFRQVDKSYTRNHEGSGIGLSLIKSLVEMQDGRIWVQSEYGQGSEFVVEFPVCTVKESTMSLNNNEKDHYIQRINIEFSDIYF